jgi:ubiquinone/menaquinone biosynthesis C-methylase UbiE
MLSIKMRYALAFCLACNLLVWGQLHAEERSVRPGINSYYHDPEWQVWVNTFESPGREVYDRRWAIVDATGVRPGMAVADIGAGTGLFTRLFAMEVGPRGKVYAVDISRPFIENIERVNRELGINNVEGIVNSAKTASLPSNSIDIAFISDTYHHFEYPVSMLSSIRHSLRRGGRMVIIDFRRDPAVSSNWVMGHVRADRNRVIQEITDAGFQFIEEKPILRSNYFLVFEKTHE